MLLDTSVMIAYLRRNEAAKPLYALAKSRPIYTSSVCVAELYEGIFHSAEPKKIEKTVWSLLDMCEEIYDFGQAEARVFGHLRSNLRKQGITIDSVDVMIAATCLTHNLPLLTLNTKDFVRIPDLEMVNLD